MQRWKLRTTAWPVVGAAALLPWPAGAHGDAIVDLQAQVDALLKKVAALEQAQPARDPGPAAVPAPPTSSPAARHPDRSSCRDRTPR